MKTRLAAILAACSLWLAIPVQAQIMPPPPGPVRPAEAIKKILDLADTQVLQLAELRKSHFDKVRELTTQVRDLRRRIRELLQSPTPDAAQVVGALVIQLQGLQKQLQDAQKAYHDAALALLTETQKQKVAQIQEALKLAPQAGPLAAFGLIEGPGPGQGRGMMQFLGGPMPGMEAAPPPPEGAPGGFMMMRGRRL